MMYRQNDISLRFERLSEVVKASITLHDRFTKAVALAEKRGLALPENLREGSDKSAFPFLQPSSIDGRGRLRHLQRLQTSSLQPTAPLATKGRPQGLSIFLSCEGIVLVDPEKGRHLTPLKDARRTFVIDKFTVEDLTKLLALIQRLNAQLRDFEIEHGFAGRTLGKFALGPSKKKTEQPAK